MRIRSIALLASAVLLFASAVHGARDPNAWKIADEKMKQPRPTSEQIKATPLPYDLKNPETAWQLIIAPGTPYQQRLAAAYRAGEWFPPDVRFINRLLAARDLLRKEQHLHYWGLSQHPLDDLPFDAERSAKSLYDLPLDQRWRDILGGQWTVPTTETPYPITFEEESKAPWPWQVQQVLSKIIDQCKATANTGSSPETAWSRDWFDAALKMPCRTDHEAALFVEMTRMYTTWKHPRVLLRWLEVAENKRFPDAAQSVVFALAENLNGSTTYAMIVDLLRKNPHKQLNGQLGLWLKHLTQAKRQESAYCDWTPSTAVLIISRYAVDPKWDDDWGRLYSCAFEVCDLVQDPPFKPDWQLDPKSPKVAEDLAAFKVWFAAHESQLTAASEKEKIEIDAALKSIRDAK